MKKLLYSTLILALVASCSDKEPKLKEDNATAACFQAMDYQYDALLTKADIAKHVTIDEASYKMDISTIKGTYGSCAYTWKSDRPDIETEILGHLIKGPDDNRVEIKMLDFYTDSELKLYSQESALALFDQSYKKLSQEEYDELLANLQKEYANDAAKYEQAKGFLDMRMNFTFAPMANLGDRAYWKWHDEYGIELVVLAGVAHFTINSKTSGDQKTALDDAVKFAQEVLAKCNR